MLEPGYKAVRIVIHGTVQGVFFRDWTAQNAKLLELDGWVRNLSDGTVEALLVGMADAVDNMIKECHIGPRSAKVERVEITPARGIVKSGFEQKPSVNLKERRGS